MKTLIAFVAILGVACANSGTFGNALEGVAGLAGGLAGGAANLAGKAVEVAAGSAIGLANGAANVLFGFQQNGRAGYAEMFDYYRNNFGIKIYPNYGCCSCPTRGLVEPSHFNFSPQSPFRINGVYRLDRSQYCTCPVELVAAAIKMSYFKPSVLGTINPVVERVPLQTGSRYSRSISID